MDVLEGIYANSTLLMSFRLSRVNLFNCPAKASLHTEYSNIQLYLTHRAVRPTGNPGICNMMFPNNLALGETKSTDKYF